jgi:hypothetical protein
MRLGTTVTAISQQDGQVDVAFADGSTETYDLASEPMGSIRPSDNSFLAADVRDILAR